MASSRSEVNIADRECFSVRTAPTPLKYQNYFLLTRLNTGNKYSFLCNVLTRLVIVPTVVAVYLSRKSFPVTESVKIEMSSVIFSLVTRPDQDMWTSWLFLSVRNKNIYNYFLFPMEKVEKAKKIAKKD